MNASITAAVFAATLIIFDLLGHILTNLWLQCRRHMAGKSARQVHDRGVYQIA